MKFYLLEHGHCYGEDVLHTFDTDAERVAKTRELIFGDGELSPDHEREFGLRIMELRETGSTEFEGDPSLEWFNATPAR